MSNVARSIDTVIRLNGVALGGQQGANLIRQTEAIDITNRINGDWAESLAGKKSWNIVCSGLYITNDRAFGLLEDAFPILQRLHCRVQALRLHILQIL